MTCQELVELVTDYLENALPDDERERFELHLSVCPGCIEYVDQMRVTIRAVGHLSEEAIEPPVRDQLLDVFRDWRRGA
jgi:anti-sigma factor RsiW